MIQIRMPDDIYRTQGEIQRGTFSGRWHFSFGDYRDPEYTRFGTLRVFNDDIFSPGAVWPMHPHREIEVVTYCANGEFLHEDEHGKGGVLKKGWVQHTTVGKGISHSEINNRQDMPLRFIQMWFFPAEPGYNPSVEQKPVDLEERMNRLFPLVSNEHENALRIRSYAQVYSSFLQAGRVIDYLLREGHGGYLYVLEGGPVLINGNYVPNLGAAKIQDEFDIRIKSVNDSEILFVDVLLI